MVAGSPMALPWILKPVAALKRPSQARSAKRHPSVAGEICELCYTAACRLDGQFRAAALQQYRDFTGQLRRMIREVRAATDRPFNVNVFCNRPAVADGAGSERLCVESTQLVVVDVHSPGGVPVVPADERGESASEPILDGAVDHTVALLPPAQP